MRGPRVRFSRLGEATPPIAPIVNQVRFKQKGRPLLAALEIFA
jgi:hypothetical protein